MPVPLFTFDSQILQVCRDGFDTMINIMGKPCRLYYPGLQVQCANCIFDTVSNKSSNAYRSGGPTPFPRGMICPACEGNGYYTREQTETITLLCNFEPKEHALRNLFGDSYLEKLNIRLNDGTCLTKGYLTDLPKVMSCVDAVLATNVEGYNRLRFQLVAEPVDNGNIVKGRYFLALWVRRG